MSQVEPQSESSESFVESPITVALDNALDPSESKVMQASFRQREEFTVLLFGFVTGLTIAGIFLVYVVFDVAKLLP